MPPAFFSIVTTLGLQRLAQAQQSGTPLIFRYVAVGDGDGSAITPDASMTELVNERARVLVNSVEISQDDPTAIRIQGIIPSGTGGFTIREAGFFNAAGELIVVASYPPTYKPSPSDGVLVQEYIEGQIQYAAVEAVALTVDPNVIVATRLDVDDATGGMLFLWERFT